MMPFQKQIRISLHKEKCLVTQKLCIVFGNISRPKVLQHTYIYGTSEKHVGIHFLFIECRKKLFSLPFLLFWCSSFKNEWVVASQQWHHKRQQKAFESYFFYFTVLSCVDQITQVVQFCLSFQCYLILQVRLHT